MPSQALKRISIRWLPEPAYEDTDTIALNVEGYFVDLRVKKEDSTIQWSRAGERIVLKHEPPTFRWTHIIDSLDLTVPDDAHFEKLANGDDLEIGTTPCPFRGGVPTAYEEVWRDITSKSLDETSWILQSSDGTSFIGKVGTISLAIHKGPDGEFTARWETRLSPAGEWNASFKSGDLASFPQITAAMEVVEQKGQSLAEGDKVTILSQEYVIRAISKN